MLFMFDVLFAYFIVKIIKLKKILNYDQFCYLTQYYAYIHNKIRKLITLAVEHLYTQRKFD